MFRKWGERRWEVSVLDGLARTHLAAGATEQALVHCREALECRRTGGDRAGEAETLDTLGRVHQRRGELGAARSALTRALALARSLSSPLAADIHHRLTDLPPDAGEFPAADRPVPVVEGGDGWCLGDS